MRDGGRDDWDDDDGEDASDDGSTLDGLGEYVAADIAPDTDGDIDALQPLEESPDAEPAPVPLISATNPPGDVTVTTYINGIVHRVDLGSAIAGKTEAELAEEICAVAGVAAKKATSAMHIFSVELLTAQGLDRGAATDLVTGNTPFATPSQARAAEADLVARYAPGDD